MLPLHDDIPTTIKPIVTITLIIACVVAFMWQISLDSELQQSIFSLGVIPSVLFHHKPLLPELAIVLPAITILTSM